MTRRPGTSGRGPQKTLASLGSSGKRVRVFVQGGLVRVQWRVGSSRRTESWPDSRENRVRARAYAEGVVETLDRRGQSIEVLTLQALHAKYLTAHTPSWRPATRVNAIGHWKLFTLIVGDTLRTDAVTPELMDEVVVRLRKMPARGRARSPVTVAEVGQAVRRVFRWAALRQLVARDPLVSWRPAMSKDDRRRPPSQEYTPAEVAAILARLNRRHSRQWRGWVMTMLCATTGRRQRAVLALTWADVDLSAGTLRWRAETDKLGREMVIPLSRGARHALRVARVWGGGDCWTNPTASPFVLPSAQGRRAGQPWTYAAANRALHDAEARAGIPRVHGKAFHGFRRGVVTSIHEATGNLEQAGEFVGDFDVRTLRRSYLKVRPAKLEQAARIVGNPLAISEPND